MVRNTITERGEINTSTTKVLEGPRVQVIERESNNEFLNN
jgi:hypothetical protein